MARFNDQSDQQTEIAVALLVPDMPTTAELVLYLSEIDQNKWYSNFGPLCTAFEREIATQFFPEMEEGDQRLVSCSNGTAAIELALLALGLPAGTRVLLPAFTFPATATAVISVGFEPLLADVDARSWQLTPEIARHLLSLGVRFDVVLPVATLGMPHSAMAWQKFSHDTGIPVIIDAAASLGVQDTCQGISVCYSLHATKSFGIGEGGLIAAANETMAARIRELTNFGFSKGVIGHAGGNHKLSEYHAAVGLAQCKRIPLLNMRKDALRKAYQKEARQLLSYFDSQDLPDHHWGTPSVVALRDIHFYAAAALCLRPTAGVTVEGLQWGMAARGIQTRRWYCPGLHMHPAFQGFSRYGLQGDSNLRVTEYLQHHLIGLPFHNFLELHDIRYVARSLLSLVIKGELALNIR
ncbi:Predicted DegT/DnrJ/EryC1 family protein [gamma proteobacterium HdN1]|nr:Predicted DegT/DnrJ/EryC1 family protein [gamma proteobacterium HdN1]